jgi:pimeloyl-ACP methyl ester carboxylesterase
MPTFKRDDISIYYEVHGTGFPLLLLAPGGTNSAISIWPRVPMNPLTALAGDFRLIAMDQRNAGNSAGPLDHSDPWGSYATDQLALMDHLEIRDFFVMGACIGGSFILKLIEQAGHRVLAAVLEKPIGITTENRARFEESRQEWARNLDQSRDDISLTEAEQYGAKMWTGDFVLSVSKETIATFDTPMLVLPGTDIYHPAATGQEIARLAQRGQVFEPWSDGEHLAEATRIVRDFLTSHIPG